MRRTLMSQMRARPAQRSLALEPKTSLPPEPAEEERFTFFFGHEEGKCPRPELSQWYLRDFEINGMVFNCCEQWMMWSKAMLMGDVDTARKIMLARYPGDQKRLGRQVRNRAGQKWTDQDKAIWDAASDHIVFRGNFAKFTQNRDLLDRMADTCGTTLVEAAERDRIWGIGLRATDPRARSRATWNGLNKLGGNLTAVRIGLLGS